MPKRIQRKRTSGWRMPEGIVYVGRPSKWGNPFTIADHGLAALQMYRDYIENQLEDGRLIERPDLEALRGKDLACWCKEGSPCHADILLELANAAGEQ